MSEAELMHAIYENRKTAFAFYQFAPDAVGPERDAARKALLESDAALRKQLAAPQMTNDEIVVTIVNQDMPPFQHYTKNETQGTLVRFARAVLTAQFATPIQERKPTQLAAPAQSERRPCWMCGLTKQSRVCVTLPTCPMNRA